MKTSELGKSFIKSYEKLRLHAYQDAVGIWTIGYGHTRHVSPGDKIDDFQAEGFLEDDLSPGEECLTHYFALKQNQFDALSSFIFNLGVGTFLKSSIFRFLESNKTELAGRYIKFYNKARIGGELKELPGLTKRRNAEYLIYTDGFYENHA